jgi:hypothetical protein
VSLPVPVGGWLTDSKLTVSRPPGPAESDTATARPVPVPVGGWLTDSKLTVSRPPGPAESDTATARPATRRGAPAARRLGVRGQPLPQARPGAAAGRPGTSILPGNFSDSVKFKFKSRESSHGCREHWHPGPRAVTVPALPVPGCTVA